MGDFKLHSVNWQDGMLLGRRHFKEQEAYLEELIRWHGSACADQFGLVSRDPNGSPALAMSVTVGSGRVRVEIQRCSALTPDGSAIEIGGPMAGTVWAEATPSGGDLPVYVGFKAPDKREAGEADPQEDPPRLPYAVNDFGVWIGEPPNIPQGRYLQLGLLELRDGEAVPAAGYFPPCINSAAFEGLAERVRDYRNRIESLLSLSSRAYGALGAQSSIAEQKSDLQEGVRRTIYNLAFYLSAQTDAFGVGRHGGHPHELVVFFRRLFRVFATMINLQPALRDYLNERFFTKQAGTDVGSFLSGIDAFLMDEYDHRDIGRHLADVDRILGVIRDLMAHLAQEKKENWEGPVMPTDTITYHGQTYRQVEYSAVRAEQMGELIYLMIDVADPQAVADTVVLMRKDLFGADQWKAMMIKLGLNEARGLGETDPIEIDIVTYGAKVALHPLDMLKSPSVNQVTLIFRGAAEADKLASLGKSDLILYAV